MARFRITPNELHAKQGHRLDVDQAARRQNSSARLEPSQDEKSRECPAILASTFLLVDQSKDEVDLGLELDRRGAS